MKIQNDLLYSSDHEWIKFKDNLATIGITDFAQSELGDIIFLEMPNLNDIYNEGDTIGTIEAVKTVADLYIPISGQIIEINSKLEDNPELVNNDPYNEGWIVKITNYNKNTNLLKANQYKDLIK